MGSIVGSIAGAIVSSVISSAMKKKPKKEKPIPVEPPRQAVRPANVSQLHQQNASSALAGGTPASTLLTGPGGVSDDNVGQNTLLGN